MCAHSNSIINTPAMTAAISCQIMAHWNVRVPIMSYANATLAKQRKLILAS